MSCVELHICLTSVWQAACIICQAVDVCSVKQLVSSLQIHAYVLSSCLDNCLLLKYYE